MPQPTVLYESLVIELLMKIYTSRNFHKKHLFIEVTNFPMIVAPISETWTLCKTPLMPDVAIWQHAANEHFLLARKNRNIKAEKLKQ